LRQQTLPAVKSLKMVLRADWHLGTVRASWGARGSRRSPAQNTSTIF